MKTYLFAWNPLKWNWTTLEKTIHQVRQTGGSIEKWTVASHKKIQPGDRAFLMRLGEEPKGVMAAGFVSTFPFLSEHWNGSGKLVHRVMIDFETILNPSTEPILKLEQLKKGNLSKVNWTPQASGIEINPEIVDELEEIWFDFITSQQTRHNPFKESSEYAFKSYAEGASSQVFVTKYERNPHARKACIEHYGLSCVVCDLNFEQFYGELGRNFIHVHHLIQVSKMEGHFRTDPIKDLRPVCPNCHAMIHRKNKALSIEEIKSLIAGKLM